MLWGPRMRSLGPLLTVVLAVTSFAAEAATRTVTKLADTADGSCDADCSLREALAAAVAADTIAFAPSLTGRIVLGVGELVVDEALTIEGPGAGVLQIDGQQSHRVLNV